MPILDGRHGDAYDTFTRNSLEYGAIMETPDGARFRFTEMGGTVGVANKLYQAEAPTTNWLTQAIATAMAVGDKTILFTPGATTINAGDLAGGTALVWKRLLTLVTSIQSRVTLLFLDQQRVYLH